MIEVNVEYKEFIDMLETWKRTGIEIGDTFELCSKGKTMVKINIVENKDIIK